MAFLHARVGIPGGIEPSSRNPNFFGAKNRKSFFGIGFFSGQISRNFLEKFSKCAGRIAQCRPRDVSGWSMVTDRSALCAAAVRQRQCQARRTSDSRKAFDARRGSSARRQRVPIESPAVPFSSQGRKRLETASRRGVSQGGGPPNRSCRALSPRVSQYDDTPIW